MQLEYIRNFSFYDLGAFFFNPAAQSVKHNWAYVEGMNRNIFESVRLNFSVDSLCSSPGSATSIQYFYIRMQIEAFIEEVIQYTLPIQKPSE